MFVVLVRRGELPHVLTSRVFVEELRLEPVPVRPRVKRDNRLIEPVWIIQLTP